MDPKKQVLIAAAVTGGLIFFYGPGALRWVELQVQRHELRSEIAALKNKNERLYQESRRLREDPSYAEALYRQQLGFVRPGETVIKLKNQKSEPARRQTSERP